MPNLIKIGDGDAGHCVDLTRNAP